MQMGEAAALLNNYQAIYEDETQRTPAQQRERTVGRWGQVEVQTQRQPKDAKNPSDRP